MNYLMPPRHTPPEKSNFYDFRKGVRDRIIEGTGLTVPLCYHQRQGLYPDNQAKVRDLEKHIDPVRCLLSTGVDQMVYTLYDLTAEAIAIVEGKEMKCQS